MGRYKLGEGLTEGCIEDLECQQIGIISAEETVFILNAYDSLLKRQEECGKTGHIGDGVSFRHCFKCGKDLSNSK